MHNRPTWMWSGDGSTGYTKNKSTIKVKGNQKETTPAKITKMIIDNRPRMIELNTAE